MNILKQLEKRLREEPDTPSSNILKGLIKALCLKEEFHLAEIYDLDYGDFETALGIIKDWRLKRYTKTKSLFQ